MTDSSGKVSTFERFDGREVLGDGSIFIGYKSISKNPGQPVVKDVRKEGKIIGDAFVGTLVFGESTNSTGAVTSYERKDGTWRIYPGMKYGGYITVSRAANGAVTVVDARKRVY
jgi:hypothetical protein